MVDRYSCQGNFLRFRPTFNFNTALQYSFAYRMETPTSTAGKIAPADHAQPNPPNPHRTPTPCGKSTPPSRPDSQRPETPPT